MTGPQHDITRVVILAEQGKTRREIAAHMGITLPTLQKYIKLLGVTVQRQVSKRVYPSILNNVEKISARTDLINRMVSMYRQGLTLQKIGDQFCVTREYVRQCLKKAGVARHEGGSARNAALKRNRKKNSKEAKCFAKYGLPSAVVEELIATRVIHGYRRQQINAGKRGITWNLTFIDWFSVWQASGKLHLRGRGKGKYVMSRVSDAGSYELGNIHIQLATENSKEAVKKWRGKTKVNRGVFCLYPGSRHPWLAKAGKARLGFFETEAEAVEARQEYLRKNNSGRAVKGYTVSRGRYVMQCANTKRTYHDTPEEARAAYLLAVEAKRIASATSETEQAT